MTFDSTHSLIIFFCFCDPETKNAVIFWGAMFEFCHSG